MDLWIRSQDRMDLVKVESVILCFNKDEPDNGYSLKDKSDRWYPDILGTYKTKERALEVLDEIQEAQLGNYHYRCPSNVKVSNNENTIVYQMPEE